ncbi:uncharacterized mitochondrial protein AtMg00810-like [Miscanthus floridulus]|uniref:uncharacterized mitochondrial protein AtMg00810-like n=1 Tax=Miscanthus floridulus TaxID=154761 RepID=UPI0034578FDF
MRRWGKKELVVDVYEDDFIVTGAWAKDIDDFKREMAARLKINNLDMLSYYLGIKVRQGKEHISLSQRVYAEKLLERSNMTKCKSCATSMKERLKLSKHSTAANVDAMRYRSIVGRLRYLTHTWSDIAFAVGYVSHFMEDPREDHLSTVKRLLCYAKRTFDQAIIFLKSDSNGGLRLTVFSEAPLKAKEGEPELTIFSDTDMTGDING